MINYKFLAPNKWHCGTDQTVCWKLTPRRALNHSLAYSGKNALRNISQVSVTFFSKQSSLVTLMIDLSRSDFFSVRSHLNLHLHCGISLYLYHAILTFLPFLHFSFVILTL